MKQYVSTKTRVRQSDKGKEQKNDGTKKHASTSKKDEKPETKEAEHGVAITHPDTHPPTHSPTHPSTQGHPFDVAPQPNPSPTQPNPFTHPPPTPQETRSHLSSVSKVSKLRLPQAEGVRVLEGITHLKAEHAKLREDGIPDRKLSLPGYRLKRTPAAVEAPLRRRYW